QRDAASGWIGAGSTPVCPQRSVRRGWPTIVSPGPPRYSVAYIPPVDSPASLQQGNAPMFRRRFFMFCIWSIATLGLQISAAYCSAAELVLVSSLNFDDQPKANAKANSSADGNPLSINGEKYQLGLGAKAPSKIVIDLKRGAERFLAKVGLDDEVPDASAQITVWGGDRRLSPAVQARAPPGRGQFGATMS